MPAIFGSISGMSQAKCNGAASGCLSSHRRRFSKSCPQSALLLPRWKWPPRGPPATSLKYERLCGKAHTLLLIDQRIAPAVEIDAHPCPAVNDFAARLTDMNKNGNAGRT